jgi:hypothetical protein
MTTEVGLPDEICSDCYPYSCDDCGQVTAFVGGVKRIDYTFFPEKFGACKVCRNTDSLDDNGKCEYCSSKQIICYACKTKECRICGRLTDGYDPDNLCEECAIVKSMNNCISCGNHSTSLDADLKCSQCR